MIIWVQILWGPHPKNLGGQKQKVRRDFGQLWTLTANISSVDRDIKNRKQSLSTTIPPTLNKKKLGEIWSTNKNVIGVGIDPPTISTARAVHRLTQLRSCRACHVTLPRPELQPPNCPQSDLGRRAATRWALPSISSFRIFFSHKTLTNINIGVDN